jgi:hypothetical protein
MEKNKPSERTSNHLQSNDNELQKASNIQHNALNNIIPPERHKVYLESLQVFIKSINNKCIIILSA